MSDATDKEAVLDEVIRRIQPDLEPVLTLIEIEDAVDNNQRAFTWVTALPLVYGDEVIPTVKNGHRYMVVTAGTTTTEPTWPTSDYGTVTAGAQFQEAGAEYDNVYSIKAILRELWELRMAKSVEMISNPVSGNEAQIYEHCKEMALRYATPLLA